MFMDRTFRLASLSKNNLDIFSLGKVMNRLDRCGVLLCRAGSVELMVDDRPYCIEKGDVYIYMPSTMVRPVKLSDDCECLMVSVDINYVIQGINKISNIESVLYLRDNPFVQVRDIRFTRLLETFAVMQTKMAEIEKSSFTGLKLTLVNEIVKSIGSVALFQLLDIFFENKPSVEKPHSKKDVVFFKFITSLYKNYSKERDVAFYAEELNLSSRYFSSIVKEKSGHSALQWIVHVVIGEIKHQLETTDLTIKELSVRLNFPTQSFFGKYFKQYVGMSPKDYRRKTRAENKK